MEGNDSFYVLSTNPAVETRIFGGLGSDRVEVGAQAPAVQADDLLGHTGLVRNSVESTVAGSWSGIPVDGIAAEILDDDAPALSVDTIGGTVVVGERTPAVYGTIRVRPTKVPTTDVEVTIVAPAIDINGRSRALELSLDDGVTWQTSVTLVFAAGSTAAQIVRVRAMFDNATEGDLLVPLQTMVTGRLTGTTASATATSLTAAGHAVLRPHAHRAPGRHHERHGRRPDPHHPRATPPTPSPSPPGPSLSTRRAAGWSAASASTPGSSSATPSSASSTTRSPASPWSCPPAASPWSSRSAAPAAPAPPTRCS